MTQTVEWWTVTVNTVEVTLTERWTLDVIDPVDGGAVDDTAGGD